MRGSQATYTQQSTFAPETALNSFFGSPSGLGATTQNHVHGYLFGGLPIDSSIESQRSELACEPGAPLGSLQPHEPAA